MAGPAERGFGAGVLHKGLSVGGVLMREWFVRLVLGVVIPVAVLAAGFGPWLAYRSELPDRVASHWSGFSGPPDDSMTPRQFLVVVGIMAVVGVALCVGAAFYRGLPSKAAMVLSFFGGFLGALGSVLLAIVAVTQRGLERWQDAALEGWETPVMFVSSLAVGGLSAWIARLIPLDEAAAEAERTAEAERRRKQVERLPKPKASPMSPDAPIGRAWDSTLQVWWPLLISLPGLVAGGVIAQLVHLWFGIALMAAALAVAALCRIRVSADESGLKVSYGLFGWPRTSVPLDRMAEVQPIDVVPIEWGGWGYRGSLKLMKRAAVVLRAGPGLRIDLRDGKVFAVTVDDPHAPARLLNAEIARRA